MSYTSSAAFATSKRAFMDMLMEAQEKEDSEKITEFLTKHCDYIGIVGNEKDDCSVVVIRWWDVKWYDEFPSIRFLNNWMSEAPERNIGFEFIRCGEDYDDTKVLNHNDGHGDLGWGEYVGVLHEPQLLYEGEPFSPSIPAPEEDIVEPVVLDDLDNLLGKQE